MKAVYTESFEKDYNSLALSIQKQTNRKLGLLLSNMRHPSLRVKKMEGTKDIWEASVTKSYRITFNLLEDCLILRRIGTHDILRKP